MATKEGCLANRQLPKIKKGLLLVLTEMARSKQKLLTEQVRKSREDIAGVSGAKSDECDEANALVEASFQSLACQARRNELFGAQALLREIGGEIPSCDHVSSWSLVECRDTEFGRVEHFFFMPKETMITNGHDGIIDIRGKQVALLSLCSPIGEALMGKRQGETADVQQPDGLRPLELLAVC